MRSNDAISIGPTTTACRPATVNFSRCRADDDVPHLPRIDADRRARERRRGTTTPLSHRREHRLPSALATSADDRLGNAPAAEPVRHLVDRATRESAFLRPIQGRNALRAIHRNSRGPVELAQRGQANPSIAACSPFAATRSRAARKRVCRFQGFRHERSSPVVRRPDRRPHGYGRGEQPVMTPSQLKDATAITLAKRGASGGAQPRCPATGEIEQRRATPAAAMNGTFHWKADCRR